MAGLQPGLASVRGRARRWKPSRCGSCQPALQRIMATIEEIEPGTITLLITEATGAHFRLHVHVPASPVTVGDVEAALSVASGGGRPANSVRLVSCSRTRSCTTTA